MKIELFNEDCLTAMRKMPTNSVDSIVTDPPYGLSFMGKKWDYDVPSEEIWRECLRVLKPGGHLLAFAGTRTQHRMAVRIEDAGFEIRDMIAWVYGSGFPKSHNVSKAIDKLAGADREVIGLKKYGDGQTYHGGEASARTGGGIMGKTAARSPSLETAPATNAAKQWNGWGTALKPALEPITLARKPLTGTVADNVLTHGTGGINVDGCRVETSESTARTVGKTAADGWGLNGQAGAIRGGEAGRWPANLIHDGSDEVAELFPKTSSKKISNTLNFDELFDVNGQLQHDNTTHTDSAARFFYCAKASKKDRDEGLDSFKEKPTQSTGWSGDSMPLRQDGTERKMPLSKNNHPTVKPTELMRYLCKLVTPPNGTVLDPFMGSGSTGKAAKLEGFGFVGIERELEYFKIAEARVNNISK